VIGVDTNVLVRLFTADDAEQHEKAASFFRERSAASPAFVSAVTMAETVWVLGFSYRLSQAAILDAMLTLLETDDLVVEAADALLAVRDAGKPALLADFIVVHLGRRAGCSHSVTFDRQAARAVPGMELLA
jgi:predicted nucleic-acid-binding protein